MKKLILTVAFAFGFVALLNAQDLTSKKGEPFLPKQGDWAIGIDAAPFLPLLGNGGAPSANYLNNADKQIVFKVFLQDDAALRIKLRIGMNSNTKQAFVMDDQRSIDNANVNNQYYNPAGNYQGEQFKDPTKLVTDEMKTSETNINLAIGYEKRKGTTRLQGYMGGELMLGIGSGKSTTFTYGNGYERVIDNNAEITGALAQHFLPAPTIDGFDGAATKGLDAGYIKTLLDETNAVAGSARNLEVSAGSTFAFGLRGFIGAEYFILPKMSVGVEYGWGLGIASQGNGSTKVEYWGTAYNYTTFQQTPAAAAAMTGYDHQEATVETGGNSGMTLDTDLSYGAIFLNLHF